MAILNSGQKDLLTLEEKATYFEIKAKLYRHELYDDLSDTEYRRLYTQASELLLAAVDRDLTKRGAS